jgi:hypothetical protein
MKAAYTILLLEKNYNKALEIQKHLAYNATLMQKLSILPALKKN